MCLSARDAAGRARSGAFVYPWRIWVYPPMALYREDLAWSANPHPADQYAAWAKRIAEKQIEAMGIQYGMPVMAIVRPVNCFGPFDNFDPKTALVVPALIARAEAGENPLVIWGDGSAVRDFLFVDDVVDGLLRAYERGLGKGPINLGSGVGYSIREVAETVVAACGRNVAFSWDLSRPSGEPRKIADIARARDILGFAPLTSLAEAVARTVRWYREQDKHR